MYMSHLKCPKCQFKTELHKFMQLCQECGAQRIFHKDNPTFGATRRCCHWSMKGSSLA